MNFYSNYSKKEGLKRTLKNVSLTYGIPGLIYFLNSYKQWLPTSYSAMMAPVIAGIIYFLKNYLENK